MKKTYVYNGPVMSLDGILEQRWKCTIQSTSEKRAKRMLMDKYRKEHDLPEGYLIVLPAQIVSRFGSW